MSLIFTGCVTNWVNERGFPAEHQIVNFDKVDEHIYRGAQPNHNGIDYLKSIGVKSVVNLRTLSANPEESDVLPGEKEHVESLGMQYLNWPMSGAAAPTVKNINELLPKIAALPGPVFIHCQFGCDRTGLVVACWRIRVDHWTNADALAEAEHYGISKVLWNFKHFVKQFDKPTTR